MTTTITINFTASPGSVGLDDAQFFGAPAGLMNTDLKTSNPLAWIAANEFLNTGATSGVITITAE